MHGLLGTYPRNGQALDGEIQAQRAKTGSGQMLDKIYDLGN
jgi:hypothetical protein